VIFWFAGPAWLLVWRVFRSPAVDYRLVVLGALLPLLDLVVGHATPLHTVAGAVTAMALVMAVARGRRLAQRQWLGIPIGMFTHLLLDATWADTDLFWWPVGGVPLADLAIPEAGWSAGLVAVLELIGLAVLFGLWVRLGLTAPDRRSRFFRTGHLAREVA
jgi:membrane-bound metal-dependent hydrolase YbcI (DUF457 family)